MTITVTPNPTFEPPRNAVVVSVTAGRVMSSVSVWRNDSNGRELVRSQPAAGFDSRTVYDYEAPYGELVTYDWTSLYTDPASYVVLFNETWASTAAWTGGSYTVSAGKVSGVAASGAFNVMNRFFAPAKYRVTIGSMAFTGAGVGSIGLAYSGLSMQLAAGGTLIVNGATTSINPATPFVVDFNSTTVTISGAGGTFTVVNDLSADRVRLSSTNGTLTVGSVKVETYPVSSTITETSSAVTLDSADAWLVHPSSPALSFRLSETDMNEPGVYDIGDVSNESNAVVHSILGSRSPVTSTTGARRDDATSMIVATVTSDQRKDLRSLLETDIPILFQFPPAWELDFNCGFYSVGTVTESRIVDIGSVRNRRHALPMIRVQSPVVDVESTGWSYAALAAEFTSYTQVKATFATYADLASNARS